MVMGADVTATGYLSLATQDAVIAQTGGTLSVGGSTDVDAGTGDVMLADAGNDFVGTVDIIGGTVAITDAHALTPGTVAAGQLKATSVGRLDMGTTELPGAQHPPSSGGSTDTASGPPGGG